MVVIVQLQYVNQSTASVMIAYQKRVYCGNHYIGGNHQTWAPTQHIKRRLCGCKSFKEQTAQPALPIPWRPQEDKKSRCSEFVDRLYCIAIGI